MIVHDVRHALSDEEAADYALGMSELERAVVVLCSKERSFGYTRLAEKTGTTFSDVQSAGKSLKAKRLAHISVARHGNEFHGSALFLNERGLAVKEAVEALIRIRAKRVGQ